MRLIDADALLKDADKRKGAYGLIYSKEDIQDAPTIEAEPVRHGHWIKIGTSCGIDVLECSECHTSHPQNGDDYCRDCGAKMDGDME